MGIGIYSSNLIYFPIFSTTITSIDICKRGLELSQLIPNHYYLERKRMLSVNGWNSGLVVCGLVTCRSCEGRLAKGGSPESEGTIVRRCLTQEQMRKGRYKGSVHKGSSGNCRWGRVFWTTDLENQNIGSGW